MEFFHDDTALPSSPENTMPDGLGGCQADCHIWGLGMGASSASYGNNRWINTWWDGYRLRESTLVDFDNCVVYDCVDGIDNDLDGLADCEDPDCFEGFMTSTTSSCQRISLTFTDSVWSYAWYFNDMLIAGANDSFYEDLSGLPDGNYEVEISHPSGCSAIFPEIIDCVAGCFDGEILQIEGTCELVSVVSPQPDWTYTWFYNEAEIIGATDSFYGEVGGLNGGFYEVIILDGDDCTVTLSQTLDCCKPPNVSVSGN